MKEIYISVDIEADGRVPGLSSMLSLGAAAFTIDKVMHGWWTCNFELLEDAQPEPETTEFWDKHRDAYNATRRNTVSPWSGVGTFVAWIKQFKDYRPLMVAYPAVYDFKWIDYYCVRFADENPFGFSGCIDLKSLAWATLGGEFSHVVKRNFPQEWFDPKTKHTHVALEDAIEQGRLFVNIARDTLGLPRIA